MTMTTEIKMTMSSITNDNYNNNGNDKTNLLLALLVVHVDNLFCSVCTHSLRCCKSTPRVCKWSRRVYIPCDSYSFASIVVVGVVVGCCCWLLFLLVVVVVVVIVVAIVFHCVFLFLTSCLHAWCLVLVLFVLFPLAVFLALQKHMRHHTLTRGDLLTNSLMTHVSDHMASLTTHLSSVFRIYFGVACWGVLYIVFALDCIFWLGIRTRLRMTTSSSKHEQQSWPLLLLLSLLLLSPLKEATERESNNIHRTKHT